MTLKPKYKNWGMTLDNLEVKGLTIRKLPKPTACFQKSTWPGFSKPWPRIQRIQSCFGKSILIMARSWTRFTVPSFESTKNRSKGSLPCRQIPASGRSRKDEHAKHWIKNWKPETGQIPIREWERILKSRIRFFPGFKITEPAGFLRGKMRELIGRLRFYMPFSKSEEVLNTEKLWQYQTSKTGDEVLNCFSVQSNELDVFFLLLLRVAALQFWSGRAHVGSSELSKPGFCFIPEQKRPQSFSCLP